MRMQPEQKEEMMISRLKDTYGVIWQGTDARGRRAPAGVYYCMLKLKDKSIKTQVLLTR